MERYVPQDKCMSGPNRGKLGQHSTISHYQNGNVQLEARNSSADRLISVPLCRQQPPTPQREFTVFFLTGKTFRHPNHIEFNQLINCLFILYFVCLMPPTLSTDYGYTKQFSMGQVIEELPLKGNTQRVRNTPSRSNGFRSRAYQPTESNSSSSTT